MTDDFKVQYRSAGFGWVDLKTDLSETEAKRVAYDYAGTGSTARVVNAKGKLIVEYHSRARRFL